MYLLGKIKSILFGDFGGTETKVAVDTDGHLQIDLLTINVGDHASRHVTSGEDFIDGDLLDVTFTPSSYTPDASPAEAVDVNDLAAHLKGIDTKLTTITSTMQDDDGDTKIQLEESSDEDIIRFDAGTIEVGIWDAISLTMPLQPLFSAYGDTDLVDFAINTNHTLAFNQERTDQGSDYNTGTYTFTAPATGPYLLIFAVKYHVTVDASAQFYKSAIVTSNRTYVTMLGPKWASDPNYHTVLMVLIADMDINDTAYCYVNQQGGAQQTDVDHTDGISYFQGFKMA